jgi:hypothetical protein
MFIEDPALEVIGEYFISLLAIPRGSVEMIALLQLGLERTLDKVELLHTISMSVLDHPL